MISSPSVKGHSIWLVPSQPEFDQYHKSIGDLARSASSPAFTPHITLLGQIPGDVTWIKAQTEELFSDVHRFKLSLTHVGMFDTHYRSIILHVKGSPRLEELYTQSLQLYSQGKSEPFVPHLSLLYSDLLESEKIALMKPLTLELPQIVSINEAVLMETRGGPQDWREVARYTLN